MHGDAMNGDVPATHPRATATRMPLTHLSATDPLRWEMKADKAFALAAAFFAVCCKIAMLGFPRFKDPSQRISTATVHAAPLRAAAHLARAARDIVDGAITAQTWENLDDAVFTLDNAVVWFSRSLTDDEVAAVDGLAEIIDDAERLFEEYTAWSHGHRKAYGRKTVVAHRRGGV